MRIGFVGLGNMGQAMAMNLVRAGHQIAAYNRTASRAESLASMGATVAASPAEAASAKEVVITMLADDAAVESLVFGPRGVIEGLPQHSLHISMSTISPSTSQRLAAEHKERVQEYVAAPVFGRPEAAAQAKLFIVAAGSQDAISTAKPVFEVLGQRTFVVDERPEQANYIKLFGNFMITCALESLGEVFAVARKADINPSTVFEVLSGTLFNAPVYHTYGPRILEENFSPAGFRMPLGLKDIRLGLQAAANLNAPMPFANIVHDRFLTAIANGCEDLDWSAIALGPAEDAGLPRTRIGSGSKTAA